MKQKGILRSAVGAVLAIAFSASASVPSPPESPVLRPSSGQGPDEGEGPKAGFDWTSALAFAGGAAAGLAIHESGHVIANFAFGNVPHLEAVHFGFIPWFAISPGIRCFGDRCQRRDGSPFTPGRPALFTILFAGLQLQHIEDEIILTYQPKLRFVHAPFRKGMVAFNTVVEIGYVLANWANVEPEAGDLHGIYRDTGAPRTFLNVMLLSIALLDLTRYFFPDLTFIPWVSRVNKVTVTGVTFAL